MANLSTGSLSALNQSVVASPLDNFGTIGIIITGTWSGTISIQGSLDSTTFVPMIAQKISSGLYVGSITTNDQLLINVAGMQAVKIIMTSYTSGSADIVIQGNAAVSITSSLSTLVGAGDATKIGNTGDRLKVDSLFSNTAISMGAPMPVISMPLKYEDMNVSTGGVARETTIGTTYTTVYNRSGSGLFIGMLLTLENANDDWLVKFSVDGVAVFEFSTKELNDGNIYNFDKGSKDFEESFAGIFYGDKTFRWVSPHNTALVYNSSVRVEIKRNKSDTKKFRAGLAVRTTN